MSNLLNYISVGEDMYVRVQLVRKEDKNLFIQNKVILKNDLMFLQQG